MKTTILFLSFLLVALVFTTSIFAIKITLLSGCLLIVVIGLLAVITGDNNNGALKR